MHLFCALEACRSHNPVAKPERLIYQGLARLIAKICFGVEGYLSRLFFCKILMGLPILYR